MTAPLVATYYTSLSNYATNTGGTTLDKATALSLLDELRDIGYASVEQLNTATTLPSISADGVVALTVGDGVSTAAALAFLVEKRDRIQIRKEAEAEQRTTVGGPSILGVFNRGVIVPSGGTDRSPEVETVQYNWTHPSYVPDMGVWDAANDLGDVDTVRAWMSFATSGTLADVMPEFKSGTASCLAPTSGTLLIAPEGDWYGRSGATSCYFPADGYYTIYVGSDDEALVWVDGIPLVTSPGVGQIGKITEFFTSGYKSFTFSCHNFFDSPFFPGLNPTFVAIACYAGGGDYEAATPTWETNSSWIVNDYPADMPGMTPGTVGLLVLQDQIDRGATWASLINPTFDEDLDSNGDPWPEFHNITATVGSDKCMDLFRKMMTYACDMRMTGAFDWDMFIFGAYNPTSGVTFGTTNLTSLEFHSEAPVADAVLTRSDALGWHRVGSGEVEGYLALGSEVAGSEVTTIGTELVSEYGRVRAGVEFGYVTTVGFTPYINADFVPGCDVTVPDEAGSPTTERVQSIAMSVDENNENLQVTVTVRDHMAEQLERLILETKG